MNKKKTYTIILTMEGAKKYLLLMLAFEALPDEDVFILGTRQLKDGTFGVVYRVRANWKQYKLIEQILGDYIVG